MKATILTIGDELLIGQVVDTNAAWLGDQLTRLGVDVVRRITVGDDEVAIRAALVEGLGASDLVLLTGGLGPTHDDLTVEVLGRHFDAPLHLDKAVLQTLLNRWKPRGRSMPESNRKMALVPDRFEVLPNSIGSAPGLWFAEHTGGRERVIVVLPGVPREMKALFENEVLPRLRLRSGLRAVAQKTLHTAGIGESDLQEKIGDLSDLLGPDLRLAYLPGTSGVRLRLTAMSPDPRRADEQIALLEARLRARIDEDIYGTDGAALEEVVGQLLSDRNLTIATAESCTGGLVAHQLTVVPGASKYVRGGIIAYHNAIKEQLLGVDVDTLVMHGAVSEPVARQMARGVRAHLGADIGLSTTGVAGPGGGSEGKPVGTVWIGVADADGEFARCYHFSGDRATNKELGTTAALDLVRRKLI